MVQKVSDFTALISNSRWNGMANEGAPVFITYCLLDSNQIPTKAEYWDPDPGVPNNYSAMNATQRANVRLALEEYEKVAGVQFIEVENRDDAMLRIMNSSGSDYGGWADFGNASENSSNVSWLVIDGPGNYPQGASYEFETILHELGHAMGMKHPFSGAIQLINSLDNEDHTLMSYTGNGATNYDSVLAHLDVDALQFLYGNSLASSGWFWSWSEISRTFVLEGGGAGDVLIGVDAKNDISGYGGADMLFGRNANDTLRGGAGGDLLVGGKGNDAMFGGGGNDTFHNSSGNDTYNGGKGSDTMSFAGFGGSIVLSLSSRAKQSAGFGSNKFLNIENVEGGRRADTLTGNKKANDLDGNAGKDKLKGNGGNDALDGGGGVDILNGGGGRDSLKGGGGRDRFDFEKGFGRDTLLDFQDNKDTVRVSKSLTGGNMSATQLLDQFGHQKGDDYILKFNSNNVLKILDTNKAELMNDVVLI